MVTQEALTTYSTSQHSVNIIQFQKLLQVSNLDLLLSRIYTSFKQLSIPTTNASHILIITPQCFFFPNNQIIQTYITIHSSSCHLRAIPPNLKTILQYIKCYIFFYGEPATTSIVYLPPLQAPTRLPNLIESVTCLYIQPLRFEWSISG